MAGRGAGATSALVFGGFLCLALVLLAIAAAIILSLIPIYTPNNSQQGYGSVYTIDSFLSKYIYQNSSGAYFLNGTVANSTDLSQRCTAYFQTLGIKNFAGCLIFNSRAWGPYNNSGSYRRRRRAVTTTGMYAIGTANIYRTVSCPSVADFNKTANSTRVSHCNALAIAECNLLIGYLSTTLTQWLPVNTLLLDILDGSGYYDAITITTIYAAPPAIAVAIANNLTGVSDGTRGELQRGCRYAGALPISTINAILASQSASNNVNSATTIVPG